MKTYFVMASLVLAIGPVHAEDIWFALDELSVPPPAGTTQYASADAACRVAYQQDVEKFTSDVAHVLAYVPPTLDPNSSTPYVYLCSTPIVIAGDLFQASHAIQVVGDRCPDGETFDFAVGQCAIGDDAQDRKQKGDPNDDPNNDPNDCQGNPINAAIGNKFERNLDFADQDGELRFERFYNGLDGSWRYSYGATLVVGLGSALLTFEDGRASMFTVDGAVGTGEPSERGSLVKSGSRWVYSSPANEVLTFNAQGQLVSLRKANGQTQTITYGFDQNFNNKVTVKDSRGHTLSFTVDFSNRLVGLTAPGVTAAYTYSTDGQLTNVARTVNGKSVSRSYLYENADRPFLLTGMVDEKGVRAASWSYDSLGRAISSEHAGGADNVTIAYADDGTTSVTNALGHVVTYTYVTVAGTRRMSKVKGEPVPGCPIANSSFTYDVRGQIATKTDALGHVTAFTYDAQGRETSRVEAQGTPEERTIATTWDGTSFRPASVTTPDHVTSYTYDAQGRLLSSTVHSTRD